MASENGNYAVEVNLNGCTELSEAINVSTLKLEKFSSEELRLYPIPSNDVVTIDSNEDVDIELSIFDVSGKLQQKTFIKGKNDIDIRTLTSGIYFFKFLSKDKTATLKFIKE